MTLMSLHFHNSINKKMKNPNNLSYLTGLKVQQFDLILAFVEPYIHLIPYPHSKGSDERSLDTKPEIVAVLAICRQSLYFGYFGVMAMMLDKSRVTVQRLFTAGVILLATVFNQVDLRPSGKCLLYKMPNIFKATVHDKTDLVIDATGFKCQSVNNFSNYKNIVTGKALIGIAPHGMELLFSDVYPRSMSDSEITEKAGDLNFVQEEHEILSDKGVSIQELCAIKGSTLNRPEQNESHQFSQKMWLQILTLQQHGYMLSSLLGE